jgi:hypothetical protein
MMITLSHLYPDGARARAVVDELRAAGLPEDDIGIIAPSSDRGLTSPMENAGLHNSGEVVDRDGNDIDDRTQGAVKGAALGGAAGLLAGLGAFVLPGIGAVAAAGWLMTAVAGAVAGGTAGGIIGALVEAGIDENDAGRFADAIRRGATLVTVRMAAEDREFYEDILDERSGRPPRTATNFDPAGMPRALRSIGPATVRRP